MAIYLRLYFVKDQET